MISDVTNEANLLASLCHPYLPSLFGVCMKEKPFRLVMQFYVIDGIAIYKGNGILTRSIYTIVDTNLQKKHRY